MASSTAQELYRSGHLQEAIQAATEGVRQSPTDTSTRGLLCELLCFAGEFERADRQLDALSHQDSSLAVGISLLRQLVRAEQARQQFYTEGRLPEFIGPPTPLLSLHLQASICLRENKGAEAERVLAEAQTRYPTIAGTCDGQPFEGLRDTDDLTACFFEVLTSTGKYFWIPMEQVESIEFRPPRRPHDLLWRSAQMVVHDGPDGEVFLPAVYAGTASPDDRIRLGRITEWAGGEGTPIRGLGQRVWQIGNDDRPIMELRSLNFAR